MCYDKGMSGYRAQRKLLERKNKRAEVVTKQTGAHSCGTLMHDPTISVEGNKFLFIGFHP